MKLSLVLLFVLLTACTSSPPQKQSTGVAYAGPANLNLRKDLGAKSEVVATARHGDRLDVLETRRRFVHVRTAAGVEGWADANYLLSEQQMNDLRGLAKEAAKLRSQGEATVYEALNVHAEPYRQSPSFFQIPEGAGVEVIGHRVSPHSPPPSEVKPLVKKVPSSKKAQPKKKSSAEPLLPLPVPPPPPHNWVALSRPRKSDLTVAGKPEMPSGAPLPSDDWSLVRTHQGEAGWALSRMLVMKIPDEVAQYAEGHRITAYMSLGKVLDSPKNDPQKSETHDNWLWTTASTNLQPFEFDSVRVFVWSAKRHHYETAYIEKNLKGHYPVETESLPGQDASAFSVVVEEKDGQLYKRTYAFSGYHVRIVSKTPYQTVLPLPAAHATGESEPSAPPAPTTSGWTDKLRDWRKKWFGK